MSEILLRRVDADDVAVRRGVAVDDETLREAQRIIDEVRNCGDAALRELGERFGDLQPDDPLVYTREMLEGALDSIPRKERGVLERAADRIEAFAQAQRACLNDLEFPIPGGVASHRVTPVETAGCYAPGGRFPLPSSVLMTVITARVAGVKTVWAASPRPAPVTLAAAAIAGADALLAVGGVQAIAAMAFGTDAVPACDVIVGPGNRWVTAAKQIVAGAVRIDMLAGPSELVVIADDSADASLVAADLLAQAEHDTDAIPILVAFDESFIDAVEAELTRQLADLPTAETARSALRNGWSAVVRDAEAAVELCDSIAPEHLQLCVRDAELLADRLQHYGALFVGESSAEVFGDYGAGPNHTLPTGGSARSQGGLSVLHFLRMQTQLALTDPAQADELAADAAALARMEGLHAHARAAEMRRGVV